jgi:hypothetical protein
VVRKLLEPVAPQVAVLSLAEVVSDVTPDVVGVVGDDSGDDVTINEEDQQVEDGYEPANV